MELGCGKDQNGEWSFFQNVLLDNGYTAQFRFYPSEDWGKNSSNKTLAVAISLVINKKRKRISQTDYGEITGIGGFDVYLAFSYIYEESAQSILKFYPDCTHIRLYAEGHNSRLDEAYRKILPRLGFKINYRGFWAMEKIIEKERVCSCGYC